MKGNQVSRVISPCLISPASSERSSPALKAQVYKRTRQPHVALETGQVLLAEGDPPDSMYVVKSGTPRIRSGGVISVSDGERQPIRQPDNPMVDLMVAKAGLAGLVSGVQWIQPGPFPQAAGNSPE